ncbi:MAG: HDOD domain-containing protein [Phycisphaerales bacterium]|nr:HDOD domain-containing protein [Phycisphaerales bacterium]
MTRMDEILDRVAAIQPLPDTVMKLMNVINDPKSTIEDIIEVIRYDQAVTTQMLRICNSAYFAVSREIDSLNDAIRMLGTMKILQLVMAVHSNSLLANRQSGYGLEPGILWKHSVGVAITATWFAEKIHYANANLAFTAGLLHDVGKTILNEYVGKDFAEIVRRVNEDNLSFCEAEHAVLGFSHEEIGAKVAEKWQVPEHITRCIRHHHDPRPLTPPDPLVDAVYLANCVCLLLGIGLGADGLSYRADHEIMERYGLRESDLEIAGTQMMLELKRVMQMYAAPGQPQEPMLVTG